MLLPKEKVEMCRNSAVQTKNKIRFEFSSNSYAYVWFQLKILDELHNVFIFILKKLKKNYFNISQFLKKYMSF
jgi:replication fork clamp-binding protein CrfC